STPTDDARTIGRVARELLGELDTSSGVRLLGVGLSGLADWIQDELFGADVTEGEGPTIAEGDRGTPLAAELTAGVRGRGGGWRPGMDVVHDEHGRGWVWGSGRGVVTVRFETAASGPGPVRSFPVDAPELRPWRAEQ
ncbi:MAG: DinB/UmuC family translesion DNA polymerase, partial [Marmoricola sp.]